MIDRKADLLALLDVLEATPPPPPSKEMGVRQISVFHGSKKVGQFEEPVDPDREQWEAQLRAIRSLRLALAAGADPYSVAWLALEVGGGTHYAAMKHSRKQKARQQNATEKRRKVPSDIATRIRPLLHLKDADISRILAKECRVDPHTMSKYVKVVRLQEEARAAASRKMDVP